MNPILPLYVYCSYSNSVAPVVGNGRCSRASDWSAEAACRAEAGFQVNQTIIIVTVILALSLHIFIIITSLLYINTPVITSLLPVITVIMDHYYLL